MSALTVFNQKIEALRDVDQIAAIRCDKNCVVTAGAGSGKTMVLSYRFVRLIVEQKCHVDEILTLTFTRLAAKEMYSRIQEELYALADDEEVTKELKLFTKATITTIDAFCHRIVAADPTRYGLPFDFTLDEELSKEMAKECAQTLFKEHVSHPGLKLLATFTSPEILSDSLLVPIATGHFHPSSPFDAQRMAQLVGGEFLDYYQACLGSLYGSVEQLLKIDYHTPTFQANLAVLQDLLRRREQLSASTDFKGVYKFFTTLALTKLGGKGENREEYNAEVDTFREAVGRVEVAAWSLQEIESLDAVYAFLELYNQHYLSLKRRSGVVNHGDVAHMARDILIKNKTIREYWQKRFR
ncbi:MAG: UvrD-helicase domain-containing protein, partial [Sphaerochaetaceae bacterium]